MRHIVNRYDLSKNFLSTGELIIEERPEGTMLTYIDEGVRESSIDSYHPLIALEGLRIGLETRHKSILGINGCRLDTSYRATGGYGTHIIQHGKKADKSVSLFDTTEEVGKLCTVHEHQAAYKLWLESIMPTE